MVDVGTVKFRLVIHLGIHFDLYGNPGTRLGVRSHLIGEPW